MNNQTEQKEEGVEEKIIANALQVKERLRYKTFHRNQDHDLLRKYWPVQDHNCRTVFVDDAPPNVRKKFKKVLKTNLTYWKQMLSEISGLLANHDSHQEDPRPLVAQVRKSINATIPKVDGKRVIDVTEMFRSSTSDFRMSGYDVATGSEYVLVYFWVLFASVQFNANKSEFKTCIEECNELLHLLPPLSDKAPLPHAYEIKVLYFRAKAHSGLHNHRAAFEDAQCCGAAIRLTNYIGDDKSKHAIDTLKKGTLFDDLIQLAIGAAVSLKIQNNVPRPLFSTTEINDIEKQWGVGIFHPRLYRCHNCGISRAETKLVLCSGCNRDWVCSEECHVHGWKKHKTMCKAISRKSPQPLTTEAYERIINLFEPKVKIVWMFGSRCGFSLFCRDPISGKLFDVWYGNDIYIDDKSQKEDEETLSEALSSASLN